MWERKVRFADQGWMECGRGGYGSRGKGGWKEEGRGRLGWVSNGRVSDGLVAGAVASKERDGGCKDEKEGRAREGE